MKKRLSRRRLGSKMKKKSFFLVAAFEPSSSTTTGGEKHKSLKNLKEEEKIGMKRQLLHHYPT